MSEQLTSKVFELGNDKYLLKKGSYIPMRNTATIKDNQDKLIAKGILEPGVNFSDKTGEIFEDIILPNKTSIAGILFGSNAYKRQQTTGTIEGVIDIQYYDSEGHVIDTHTNQNNTDNKDKSKQNNQDTENIKVKGILSYLNTDIESTKKEKVELLCLWACKKGYPYNDVRKIIINYGGDKNIISTVRDKVIGESSVSEEGIENERSTHKFKNWPMNITKKGELKYEELVKKLILPDKQEQYLNLGKQPYEDDLNAESIYSLYQRIIRYKELPKEDLLSIVPHHNFQKILNVATYYQLGLDDNRSFKEDYSKILAETDKNYVHGTLKENIEETKNICKQLVEQNNDDTENKKNVNVLSQMLGVIEELMA